jgi:hypothetical protein
MTDEEFVAELKTRVHNGQINVAVRHPSGEIAVTIVAKSIITRFADAVVDIHVAAADPENPDRQ